MVVGHPSATTVSTRTTSWWWRCLLGGCDSVHGCDKAHNFEPPCANNIVDGSPAVWKVLGLNKNIGEFKITWSDV
jgi:hypothetical protein